MTSNVRLLDVVALTADIPEKSLLRGHVGTVVEVYPDGQYEVEFADEEGRTFALEVIGEPQLMLLRYRPEKVAS